MRSFRAWIPLLALLSSLPCSLSATSTSTPPASKPSSSMNDRAELIPPRTVICYDFLHPGCEIFHGILNINSFLDEPENWRKVHTIYGRVVIYASDSREIIFPRLRKIFGRAPLLHIGSNKNLTLLRMDELKELTAVAQKDIPIVSISGNVTLPYGLFKTLHTLSGGRMEVDYKTPKEFFFYNSKHKQVVRIYYTILFAIGVTASLAISFYEVFKYQMMMKIEATRTLMLCDMVEIQDFILDRKVDFQKRLYRYFMRQNTDFTWASVIEYSFDNHPYEPDPQSFAEWRTYYDDNSHPAIMAPLDRFLPTITQDPDFEEPNAAMAFHRRQIQKRTSLQSFRIGTGWGHKHRYYENLMLESEQKDEKKPEEQRPDGAMGKLDARGRNNDEEKKNIAEIKEIENALREEAEKLKNE